MDWLTLIKRYFDDKIYTTDPADPLYVGKFVAFGKITEEQYEEITGVKYDV
ncbi:XkdX family protein [Paenibacillus alvei]|uniref:XkdX family protein n=1 Tax=Paenibacillus alvei TaxID=44250 RepID=UPI0018CD56B1|nr:XkdX family protein [Paenibacillus alvei]MCY9583049.1 XkdX family protein [Paenibacillus alvei]MCY9588365.1 XkdX family protein [Paenibacillus alvei]